MISLRLTLFGSPQIHLNDRLVQLKNRKAVALLAYLVLSQLPQSREKLVSVFWPEFEPNRAFANLRETLRVLKKHLTDGWLDIRRHEVEIRDPSTLWVDVLEFQQHFHHVNGHDPGLSTTCTQCLPLLLTAIDLYRDDFLRGFTLPDSPAFDEWQAFHTDLFRENLSESLHRVVRYYTRQHQLLPAIEYARRWTAFFPWSEIAHRELIRLYGLNHQRPAALQQYQECARMLQQEFGVEPEHETQELYEAILHEELTLHSPHPSPLLEGEGVLLPSPSRRGAGGEILNNLPAQITSFIGREAEVSAVSNMLLQPDIRLITLTGPGGSGKTRLSLQVAAEMLAKMPDGVFFVSLAPISNPDLVISTIAKTLGLYTAGNMAPLDVVKVYLRQKQFLLVLDNFEQILAAAPVLIDLLTAAARVKILVTSRTVLRISGEHTYLVPPLRMPDFANFPSFHYLTQFEAIRLFTERANAINMDFTLTEENAPVVAEICARLHGLPLAIELAAAHVNMFSPKAILEQLDRPLHFLTGGSRDLPPRQQTLRNTIAWSYTLLNEEEQILFRRLAMFVGGWTVDAAEAVCTYPPTDAVRPEPVEGPRQGSGQLVDVLTCLESLLDKNLITRMAVEGELRFAMLETIREYALEQLTASGEAGAIRQRHAHVILALVEEAESTWWTTEQVAWLNRLETELGNLRAALAWSIDNMIEIGLRLAGSLEFFWAGSAYHSEGRNWLAKALANSQVCGIDIANFRAKALNQAGALAWFQGDFTTAYSLEEESVALARRADDKGCLARALLWLGISAEMQGDYAKARVSIEESIALCRHIHNTRILVEALFWHGCVTFEGCDYEQAHASAEECIALARETENIHFLASGTVSLGNIAVAQGDYVKAQSCYEQGLELHQKTQNKISIPRDLNWLGAALCAQGDYEQARTYYEKSMKIFQECGDEFGVAWTLQSFGEIALHQQHWQEARTYFIESLVLFRKQGDTRSIARSLTGLAAVTEGLEQPERAARLLGATATLLEITGVSHWRSPLFRTEYERITAAVRDALGEDAFAAEAAKGRTMTVEQAIAYGMENLQANEPA